MCYKTCIYTYCSTVGRILLGGTSQTFWGNKGRVGMLTQAPWGRACKKVKDDDEHVSFASVLQKGLK